MYELHRCKLNSWVWVLDPVSACCFCHRCALSRVPSGICSHLWCRQPSGVHSWIHQRSDQKVLLYWKVHNAFLRCLLVPLGHFFSTFDHIYRITLLARMCFGCIAFIPLCMHHLRLVTLITGRALSWVYFYVRLQGLPVSQPARWSPSIRQQGCLRQDGPHTERAKMGFAEYARGRRGGEFASQIPGSTSEWVPALRFTIFMPYG